MNTRELMTLEASKAQGVCPFNQALQNDKIRDIVLEVTNDSSFYSRTVLPTLARHAAYLHAGLYTPNIAMVDYTRALERTIYKDRIAKLSDANAFKVAEAIEDYYREQLIAESKELES